MVYIDAKALYKALSRAILDTKSCKWLQLHILVIWRTYEWYDALLHEKRHKVDTTIVQYMSTRMRVRSRGVAVITSASHAEGPQFDPGRDHMNFAYCIPLS
jgi:hypothetical protein